MSKIKCRQQQGVTQQNNYCHTISVPHSVAAENSTSCGIRCRVVVRVVPEVSEGRIAFFFRVKQQKKRLFHPEDGGTKICGNVRHFSPNNTAS
jgi:hypothetical protein